MGIDPKAHVAQYYLAGGIGLPDQFLFKLLTAFLTAFLAAFL